MKTNLADKIVVISGGAGKQGSIGQVMLQRLVDEGAIPAIIDKSERGKEYAEQLQRKGIDALFIQTDVTRPEQIESAVQRIGDKYGRIDVLINNVGVNDGVGLDGSVDDFMASLRLNLVSFWCLTKYCFPYLKASRGNVLNIGSKVALTGQGSTSAYAASKGGVLALTREWAVDFVPHQMRCNAIVIAECYTPSYETWIEGLDNGEEKRRSINEKIPLGQRMTTPEEIANTALFLISDLSSHTTGQFVFVDGGYVHLDRALLSQAR
ncbi:SDR family oxidoreductase [Lewinella sp. IMCC34191]|uniref:SDR family oxidoreductase n=1 Tax=Lewinella sp. IMCC34191 TaxID=2259172 RepID=UPI000E259C56|nr:SDR family oxidoreductase [Lewinella sp. IMCC34191]